MGSHCIGSSSIFLFTLVFMCTQIMATGTPQHLLCTFWCTVRVYTVHTEVSDGSINFTATSTFVGDRSGQKVLKEYSGVIAVRFQDPFEKILHQNASRRISGLLFTSNFTLTETSSYNMCYLLRVRFQRH